MLLQRHFAYFAVFPHLQVNVFFLRNAKARIFFKVKEKSHQLIITLHRFILRNSHKSLETIFCSSYSCSNICLHRSQPLFLKNKYAIFLYIFKRYPNQRVCICIFYFSEVFRTISNGMIDKLQLNKFNIERTIQCFKNYLLQLNSFYISIFSFYFRKTLQRSLCNFINKITCDSINNEINLVLSGDIFLLAELFE